MSRTLTVILFSCCMALLALPTTASAQPTDEQIQKAAERFGEAEKYYKVADYELALEGYKEAYLLSSEPDLLFNIGQCLRKLGRNEEALRTYKSYLQDKPDTPSKADVEAIIKDLESAPPKPVVVVETGTRAPVFFGGDDKPMAVGGGLFLTRGGVAPLLLGVVGLKRYELQASLLGIGNFGSLGVGLGTDIVSAPRRDKSVKSLLNLSGGLAVSANIASNNNGVENVLAFSSNAGFYAANTFYVTCKFAARVDAQVGLVELSADGFALSGPPFATVLHATALYTLKRAPCH